jgi:hypothetical protein
METYDIMDAVASITLILGRKHHTSSYDLHYFRWDITDRGLVELLLDTEKEQLRFLIPEGEYWTDFLDYPTDVQRMALNGLASGYHLEVGEYVKEETNNAA